MTIQQMNEIPGRTLVNMFKDYYRFYTRPDMQDLADHIRKAIDVPTVYKEVEKQDWFGNMLAAMTPDDGAYDSDNDIQMALALMYKTLEQTEMP